MKLIGISLVLLSSCSGLIGASAQLEVVVSNKPERVIGGFPQKLALLWRNPGETMLESDVQMRLMQLTSTTAATVNEARWKKLQVLPGQTIVESADIQFPAVNAETRFLVQWIQNSNQVLGSTEVLVYPTNLLAELQPLVGCEDGGLGILDPNNVLKPLLKKAKVDFVDLGNMELQAYRGKLAIIGPFESSAQVDAALEAKIKTIAKKGVAVVWIQPPCEDSGSQKGKPRPSFYSIPASHTAAVIIQPYLVAGLPGNPRSQLNLVYFCKIALHPRPLTFPAVESQP